jgi:DNA mismatch repair protein MutS2
MPAEVLERAQQQISPQQRDLERLLEELQRERDEAADAARRDRLAAQEAERIRDQLARRLDDVEESREEMLAQARQELEDELETARDRLREATRRLRAAPAHAAPIEPAAEPAIEPVAEAQEAIAEAEKQLTRLRPRRSRRRQEPGPSVDDLRPGDQVWLRGLSQPGEALSAPDGRGEIEVQIGALRTRVRTSQVARIVRPQRPAAGQVQVRISQAPAAPVGMSIEVRGHRVEEALPAVEAFLENAFRAGLPFVRIVHGKGTGTLRRVVQEQLARNPLVASYETAGQSEGGEGVTVAHLAH